MKKKTIFDGTYLADEIITPEKVAAITGVSKRTAQRWIAGHTKPRKAEAELLMLHFRGRIMPAKWPSHWRFDHGDLDIGTHAPNLAWQHIDWYSYSFYCWHRALELIAQINTRLDEIEKTATSAQIIELDRYRQSLKKLSEHQFQLPHRLTEHLQATYGQIESDFVLQEKESHRKTGC